MVKGKVTVPDSHVTGPVGMKIWAVKGCTLLNSVPKVPTVGALRRCQTAMPRSMTPRVCVGQITVCAPHRDAGSNPMTLGTVDDLVTISADLRVA